ncbi:GNAT family N-acetyltransferase [Pseudorhodoferax sp.]|uniref:GNAT family N-acetyltransferase n=1 Tax=Pseudorhodoferax sp. TaxID=1993553 RepID=UPI0039E5E7D7
MLQIRPFLPADAAGVIALVLPIQQAEFGLAVTLADQPDLADIAGFYQRGQGNFWVATADGAVVGSIGWLDIGDDQGALRKMFVARGWRGPAHGVARQLLDGLLAWATARRFGTAWLGTTEHFQAAHRFYARNGFAEIARTALPARFPVMAVDTRFFRRQL